MCVMSTSHISTADFYNNLNIQPYLEIAYSDGVGFFQGHCYLHSF